MQPLCPQLVVMLTHNDNTVRDPALVLSSIDSPELTHVGLKETGISPSEFVDSLQYLKNIGKCVYVELMTENNDEMMFYARIAIEQKADALLGTRRSERLDQLIRDSGITYFPVFDDQFAYEATLRNDNQTAKNALTELCSEPHVTGALINPFRIPCCAESLIRATVSHGKSAFVTGSINSAERLQLVAKSGAQALAVGTAIFDRAFCGGDSLSQLTFIRTVLNNSIG